MDFEYAIMSEDLKPQGKTADDFFALLEETIQNFENGNEVIEAISSRSMSIQNYHNLLKTLFYQVWVGPGTFALAGSQMDESNYEVRNYLFHHAEEEMLHWTWIVSDLRETGYKGSDPRQDYAPVETQAYLSYATYLALRFPLGRLAMAAVLEGISGRFGEKYGLQVANQLSLKPNQMRFFLGHGALDQGHSHDIVELIKKVKISKEDFARMCHTVSCTETLYKAMYNRALLLDKAKT